MTSGYLYGIQAGRLVQAPLDWAKCGTTANYRAHLRRGEKPCKACLEAERRRSQDKPRKSRAKTPPKGIPA